MSKVINFPRARTKHAIETKEIECFSTEDLSHFSFLASLLKKYRPDLVNNKSDAALILEAKKINIEIEDKVWQ